MQPSLASLSAGARMGVLAGIALACTGAGVALAGQQVTDSVSMPNTKVLGDAPATAMGNLFVVTARALAGATSSSQAAQGQDDPASSGYVAGVHWVTGQAQPSWLVPTTPAATP